MGKAKGTQNCLSYLRVASIAFPIHNRHHQDIIDMQLSFKAAFTKQIIA
jgi:hypothetical protein